MRVAKILALLLLAVGCRSPYYADQGAGVGALAGAGAGALIGDATGGNAASGALLGAGLGALTGASVGSAMDDLAAENRAAIASQLGRQVQPGAATLEEVVAMSQQGVDPTLIQNYVRTSGVARPLAAADVIYLHNNGVPTEVIQTMQSPPPPPGPAVVTPARPVVVEEHYYDYGPPPPVCFGPPVHYHYRHARRRPGVSWGISVAR